MGKGRKNKPKKNFAEKRREKQKVRIKFLMKEAPVSCLQLRLEDSMHIIFEHVLSTVNFKTKIV